MGFASGQLSGTWVKLEDLRAAERDQMLELMIRFYSGVQPNTFASDLAEKDGVILLKTADGQVRGFSTQVFYQSSDGNRKYRVLFSGDTIVERQFWGQIELMQAWGRLALDLIDRFSGEQLYWFLIAGGFRTYRFLPTFFHEYYPAPGVHTPQWAQRLMHELAMERFDGRYDRDAGVIRGNERTYRLRPGVGEITPERMHNPAIRLFQELNPGHAHGDELCCLAPLKRANFTLAGLRMLGEVARNQPVQSLSQQAIPDAVPLRSPKIN